AGLRRRVGRDVLHAFLAGSGRDVEDAPMTRGPHARDDELMGLFFNLFFNFFSLLISLAVAIVVLLGAIRMKNLQSYGFAMTAAILSIIPCTSPCCFLIGTPIGIWALVVLNDQTVKAAFR
ncbi:MAG TPA: hypothetical protein PLQ00_07185, partial [Thermoguttaceae bacterium]|nr:hypothetical protein [Thermoguttaceae bacterium]